MKGIIFTGESVRSIIAGTKTQTRRVINPQPKHRVILAEYGVTIGADPTKDGTEWLDADCINSGVPMRCPYGKPGDRLYVKEVWAKHPVYSHLIYRANNDGGDESLRSEGWRWKSPLFMPESAARLFVEIDYVYAERLQDISEEDAIAEGVTGPHGTHGTYARPGAQLAIYSSPVLAFEDHWNSINGKKHPWASNPWVWVITFKQVEPCHATI